MKKLVSLIHVVLAYIIGLAAAVTVGWFVRQYHSIIVIVVASITGTFVISIFSWIHNNNSIYSPFRCIMPMVTALSLMWIEWSAGTAVWTMPRMIIVSALILLWGGHLFYNWTARWPGMHSEDWRFADFRTKAGHLYWPLSFVSFQLFPTILVLVICLPLFSIFGGSAPLNILDAIALVVALGALGIEMIADRQLRRFVQSKTSPLAILDTGLWRYSRHPNYFGEIGFWWGIYLFGAAAAPLLGHIWSIVGPLTVTGLFLLISIPLIERHMLSYRARYAEQIRRISPLVPWPPRR